MTKHDPIDDQGDASQAENRERGPFLNAAEFAAIISPVSTGHTPRERTQPGTTGSHDAPEPVEAGSGTTPEPGNVTPDGPLDPGADDAPPAREDWEQIMSRLMKDRNWREISLVRDQMMKDAKKAFPDIEARRAWVYGELDRMYPPLAQNRIDAESVTSGKPGNLVEGGNRIDAESPWADSGSIIGLGDLPKDWPELPANASLGVEIQWVQANRLRIVEERPGAATRVKLDLALSPAPSWAALGWLETSIRSYAKFVDVAAKVSGGTDDEAAVMKRERRSIEEVKALLDEMKTAAGTCPSCQRPF